MGFQMRRSNWSRRRKRSYSGGTLGGFTITNGYDGYLRRTDLCVNAATPSTTTFGYDTASRLNSVSNGAYSVLSLQLPRQFAVGEPD
jgi:hypothetical protein